ncbi:MAG: urease accessory protein UreF [Solirubrobacteraceae bacterium]
MLELLLADGRTPSGSYAHSGGLEAAVTEGLDADGAPAFIRARLHTVGRTAAALAAAAAAAADVAGLLALDGEAAARTPVPAVRAADRSLGTALLRTAAGLWPADSILAAYREASELTPRAVVLGAVCRAAGLAGVAAARLCLYEDAAGVAAAAVKLLPLDAARATGWVAGLAVEIDALAAEAPRGLRSTCTPLLDRLAVGHGARDRRLFAS